MKGVDDLQPGKYDIYVLCVSALSCPPGMCSGGIIYKGICLRSSQLTRNSDSVPSGCSYYSPPMVWSKSDYNAICNAFGGSSNCFNVDSDFDGGRCTNHYAILSYENNGYPDVWVNGNTFQWNPVSSTTSPSCYLQSGFPTTAIYACRQVSTKGGDYPSSRIRSRVLSSDLLHFISQHYLNSM